MAPESSTSPWKIGGVTLQSRMMIGSARYPSPANMAEAITRSGAEVVTVSLRRESPSERSGQAFWDLLQGLDVRVLPNTAGCHSVREVLTTAKMAREVFETDWIKLELIGDDGTLQPDPIGLVKAAEALLDDGFTVFPYTTEDLVVARYLVEAGCEILMPWGAPIGTGQGIQHPDRLARMRQTFPDVQLLVDAGIGAPSHAARAMELGCDGVLLNTAIARAADPVAMAIAFAEATRAGRRAWRAGLMSPLDTAHASTPTVGQPFWHGTSH